MVKKVSKKIEKKVEVKVKQRYVNISKVKLKEQEGWKIVEKPKAGADLVLMSKTI